MAVFNEPTKWAQTLGKDADVVKIPDIAGDTDPSIDKIFPAVFSIPLAHGGKAIPRSVLNGLFKLLGDWSFYQQNGGIASYSNTFDYAVGSFVKYNNEFYRCIQANGPSSTVKAPGSDESTWTKIITKASLDDRLATYNAPTASKLQTARSLTLTDGLGNSGAGVSFDGSKNVTISLPPYIATQLLADKTKCFGNDYYDGSDITSLIYAGNGAGTIRNEIANGNFSRVHPGQTISGKATGTTYIVVGCNIYLHRGDTELTRNHIGLMPIQLVGNSGNLLWSGRTFADSGVNNSVQGYAPWNADNENVGKNVTCAYKDSYMAKTVIPKVINNWLKKDFEEQGISVLTFRNLFSTGFDANLPCMSYPAWKGACLYAEWADCKAVLMSEPEVYGGYRWASSPYDSQMQHLQLPLFRHRSIHEIIYADIWLKDVASVSYACIDRWLGGAGYGSASGVFRVCPLFLIA